MPRRRHQQSLPDADPAEMLGRDFRSFAEAHGREGNQVWTMPVNVHRDRRRARADQNNPMERSEFLDVDHVLEAKVDKLAEMLLQSAHTVTYTGAGISRAAGLPDYATDDDDGLDRGGHVLRNVPLLGGEELWHLAQPTLAHECIAALIREGRVAHCVNQNHDGLFEKAGVPAWKVNNIHGDWFDPSNRVVQYNQNLRKDKIADLTEHAELAQMVIAAGTSLSGMTADNIVLDAGKKHKRGQGLGFVLINLQKTEHDANSSLRIWAPIDTVISKLLLRLGISRLPVISPPLLKERVFELSHYLPSGKRRDGENELSLGSLTLSLNVGDQVHVADVKANNFGMVMDVKEWDKEGNVVFNVRKNLRCRPVDTEIFGRWFIYAALEGQLQWVPVINEDKKPAKQGISKKGSSATTSSSSSSSANKRHKKE